MSEVHFSRVPRNENQNPYAAIGSTIQGLSKAEIRRRVRLAQDLTAKWSYQYKYQLWDQFRLVEKGCAEVGITQAQYWTYRRP